VADFLQVHAEKNFSNFLRPQNLCA